MHQVIDLLFGRLRHAWMYVPSVGHGDPGEEVGVGLPIDSGHGRALCVGDYDGFDGLDEARVDVAVVFVDGIHRLLPTLPVLALSDVVFTEPTADDDLAVAKEVDGVAALSVLRAEERVARAAKREVGHRRGHTDVGVAPLSWTGER